MRVLAVLPSFAVAVAATACLSAPTGMQPGTIDATDANLDVWPPPNANIVAIAAGDLDADSRDDIIAVDAGNGRIYLLRGGVDIDPTRAMVNSASDSAPLVGLRAPAAATIAIVGGTRHVVVLDNPASGARLTVFNASLDQTGQNNAGPPAASSGQTVTLAQTTFGIGGGAVFGSVPDAVFFMEGNVLGMAVPGVMMLPEIGATPFAQVLAVGAYVVPGTPATPRVFVSEPGRAQRADSPGIGQFNWSSNRTGNDWTAQAVVDVTGTSDMFPDVVGFAPEGPNPADICVLDVQAASAPACYDTPFGMDASTAIAAGPVVAPGQVDAVLAHVNPGNPTMTSVFVVFDVRIAGTVMSDGVTSPTNFPVADGLLTLAQLDAGGKEIVLVGRGGAVLCAKTAGAAPVACAP